METVIITDSGELEQKAERISVYVFSKKERELVESLMNEIPNNEIKHYSNLVVGLANKKIASEIMSHKLMIDSTAPAEGSAETFVTPAKTLSKAQAELINFSDAYKKARGATRSVGEVTKVKNYRATFKQPLSYEIREKLKAEGIEILEGDGIKTYLLLLTPEQFEKIQAEPFLKSIEEEKIRMGTKTADRWLKEKERKEMGIQPSGAEMLGGAPVIETETYDIDLFRKSDMDAVESFLKGQGINVVEKSDNTIRVLIPDATTKLAVLNDYALIRCINKYDPPALFCNTGSTVVGTVTSSRQHIFSWKGKDQLIGVLDSGMDTTHPDLKDVVVKDIPMSGSNPKDSVGHGTHVAGIIAGRGAVVGGIAMESKLVNVSMVDASGKLILPLDYKKLLGPAVEEGARVLNLSWGTPIGGSYNEGSYKVDEFAYDNPEVLIVVAAGNSGEAPDGEHKWKTIASPASAKNVITVGAVTTACDQPTCPNNVLTLRLSAYASRFPRPPAFDENLCAPPVIAAAISSRGPTDDDSIKPEVLAPGMLIESLKASQFNPLLYVQGCITHQDNYAVCSGTSMAAPFVSGMAAMLRQYLKDERQVEKPSAALIKAMLIVAADDLNYLPGPRRTVTGYPDFDQGFGLINLLNILPHPQAPAKRKMLFDDVANNSHKAMASMMPADSQVKSARMYTVSVPQGVMGPLKIVLCWTDPPGRSVQNNLQIDVQGPDLEGVPGNAEHIFHKDPLFDKLNVVGKPYDKNNTVEVVRYINPQPGEYRIRVIAENTPRPNQGYALVFVGETDDVRFTESEW